jgi:energy-coupling factor transporter ATP-binding protein EcfA2
VDLLELSDVTYRYPGAGRPAIRGIELRVGEGEIVGLAGANDAGKSSVCLVASGLAPASVGGELTGSVVIGGVPAGGRRPHELTGLAGIVFQDPMAQRSGVTASVFEEVALGPVNLGLPIVDSVGRTRAALDAVGIAELAERHPAHLSGGQTQLMAIASILALRPRCLVVDEPTAELDAEGTALVVDALRAAAAAGVAILIAEHRGDVLRSLATRLVVLEAGRVALEGATATVLADRRLESLGVRR